MRAPVDLGALSLRDLMRLPAALDAELARRGLARSGNALAGDYAEHLFCTAMGWTRCPPSARSVDALTAAGARVQIKARVQRGTAGGRELGALRDPDGFDLLAVALLAPDFTVRRAVILPAAAIRPHLTRKQHDRKCVLIASDAVLALPGAQDVTALLAAVQGD